MLNIQFADKEHGCYELEAMTFSDAPKTKSKHALMAQFRKSDNCTLSLDTYAARQDEDRFVMAMYISPEYYGTLSPAYEDFPFE